MLALRHMVVIVAESAMQHYGASVWRGPRQRDGAVIEHCVMIAQCARQGVHPGCTIAQCTLHDREPCGCAHQGGRMALDDSVVIVTDGKLVVGPY
eukprot:3109722-Pyramimonas_sp.AAC.4